MAKKAAKRGLRNYSKTTKLSTHTKSSVVPKLTSAKKSNSKKSRSSSRKKKLVTQPKTSAMRKLKSEYGSKTKTKPSSEIRECRKAKTNSARKTKSLKKQVVLKKPSSKKKSSKTSKIKNNKKKSAIVVSKWPKHSPGCSRVKGTKKPTPLLKKIKKIVRKAKKASHSRKASKSTKRKSNNKNRNSASIKMSPRKSSSLNHLKKKPSIETPVISQSNSKSKSPVNKKQKPKLPVTRSETRKRKRQNKARAIRIRLRNAKKRKPRSNRGVRVGIIIDLTESDVAIDLTESPKVNLPTQKEGNLMILNTKRVQGPKLKLLCPLESEDSVLASPAESKLPHSYSKPSPLLDLSPICAIKQQPMVSHSNAIGSTPQGNDSVGKGQVSETRSCRSGNLVGYLASERTISTDEGLPSKTTIEEGKVTTSSSVGFGPSLSTLAGFWSKNVRGKHPSSVSSTASTSEDTIDSLRHKKERDIRARSSEGQKRAIHRSGRMLSNKRTMSRSHSGFEKRIRRGSWSGGPIGTARRRDPLISPLNLKSSNKRTLSSRRKSGSISITPSKTIAARIGFSAKKLKAPYSHRKNQEVQAIDEASALPSLSFLPKLMSDR